MGEKYVIWHVQGGLGKNIAATSLIQSLVNKHPDRKLIIVCSYVEAFINNPHIYKVIDLNHLSHFYQTYIKDKDVLIFKHDPYNESDHITQKSHIIKSWCNILNLKYQNQQPKIYLNLAQQVSGAKWVREKPLLLLQTTGGPLTHPDGLKLEPYNWARDIPMELAQYIVKQFSSFYHIIHFTRPEGYVLTDVERVDFKLPNYEIFNLVINSTKLILIDSALQHIAAAFQKPSDVFWIGTSPTVYGYNNHNNIIANLGKNNNQLINSYDSEYSLESNPIECPYSDFREIFSLDKVINSLEKQDNVIKFNRQ